MFCGCSSPTGGDGGKDGVSFTESDTSLTLAQGTFELTDGTWGFKVVTDFGNHIVTENSTFIVEDGEITLISGYTTNSGSIAEAAEEMGVTEEEVVAMVKQNGGTTNGDTYTTTFVYNSEDIKHEQMDISSTISLFRNNRIKTNENGTCFFFEETYSKMTEKYYLEKKSNSTSSNNNSSQGGENVSSDWKVVDKDGKTIGSGYTKEYILSMLNDKNLIEDVDYIIYESEKKVQFTDIGESKLEVEGKEGYNSSEDKNETEETVSYNNSPTYTFVYDDEKIHNVKEFEIDDYIDKADLIVKEDYSIDSEAKEIILTDSGIVKMLDCYPNLKIKNYAPVILDAFFVSGDSDVITVSDCWIVSAVKDGMPNALETLPLMTREDMQGQYAHKPPYYLCIICRDPNKDIKTFDEISIPNTDMPVNEMKIIEGLYVIPVAYGIEEIPDSKIVNGKYTFKFQATDNENNKSQVFSVTVGVTK